jgi:hypothetical protein
MSASKTSRYFKSKVIRIGDGYTTYATYKRKYYPPAKEDRFLTITEPYDYRPDLVSTDVFGVPDFWWRLMEANNMTDIMQFRAGRNIRVPFNILDY